MLMLGQGGHGKEAVAVLVVAMIDAADAAGGAPIGLGVPATEPGCDGARADDEASVVAVSVAGLRADLAMWLSYNVMLARNVVEPTLEQLKHTQKTKTTPNTFV